MGHARSREGSFDVNLSPDRSGSTNFASRQVGDRLNVELDPRTVAIVDTVERVMGRALCAACR